MTTASVATNSFHRIAHAKINLCLHVTGRRPDGYHTLDSLVGFAAYGDRITIHEAATDSFEIKGPFAGSLQGQSPAQNLVVKARDWLRVRHQALGLATGAVKVLLYKQLPISSGIGGGSADAAATLATLARLWRTPHDVLEDHQAIATELGADVPMCLRQSPLRVTGIGERMAPWQHVPLLPCVLVNPGLAVSTPEVFKALKTRNNQTLHGMPPAFGNVDNVAQWLAQMTRNDLQAPAQTLCPPIGECVAKLEQSGAKFARMSGSGATCFGLFDSVEKAHVASAAIAQEQPEWFVQATAILPSPPLRDEDYEAWVESMKTVRSLH
ncbi:MAG: 4-(cytidine 5'-diphospho)-2-C-methyl-D-erythritol kinase [Pseudomonadota bacterium]